MHPDQEIFHPPKYNKTIKYIAIVISFSVFSFFLYGLFGKHYGPTTELVYERKEIKKKSNKMEHTKGYLQDSRRIK